MRRERALSAHWEKGLTEEVHEYLYPTEPNQILTLNIEYIQAAGSLLATYHSDLTYIRNFQRARTDITYSNAYLNNIPGGFQAFLNEYRVARNIPRGTAGQLFDFTIQWLDQNTQPDVDLFAGALRDKDISHEKKVMASLASKILFLNDPVRFIPMDILTRTALKGCENRYAVYQPKAMRFYDANYTTTTSMLQSFNAHIEAIEEEFEFPAEQMSSIRRMRFLDKVLWTMGRNILTRKRLPLYEA